MRNLRGEVYSNDDETYWFYYISTMIVCYYILYIWNKKYLKIL